MSDRYKLPEGAIPNGEVAVMSYLDAGGELMYATWNDGTLPLTSYLGLLELAKRDLIESSTEEGL